MLKFKNKGNIEVEQSIKVIQDRLFKYVDTEYYSDNKHKWPFNNIEINPTGRNLYGQIRNDGFYISGKSKLFRKKFDEIEINGKFEDIKSKTKIEYNINSKPQNLIILLIINIVLISILFILPNASGLESEKMKVYIVIPLLLVVFNLGIPLELKKKVRQGEEILKEIITTP